MLAQYVALEADIARRWREGETVPAALLTAYRLYAQEFFDTPGRQIGRVASATPANRFTTNAPPPFRR